MNDYEHIVSVIRYLDELNGARPDLDLLAKHTGLSPAHFRRLLSSWGGLTPVEG